MGAAVNIGSIGCSIATGPRLPCPIYGTSSRAAGAHPESSRSIRGGILLSLGHEKLIKVGWAIASALFIGNADVLHSLCQQFHSLRKCLTRAVAPKRHSAKPRNRGLH